MAEIKGIVAVFPGQGSQRQGMGKDFYDQMSVCRQAYEEASDAVGLDIASICFQEDDRLNLTEYTQPCIVTTEVAMIRGLAERYGFQANYFGGHSLGEFTALVAAGVIPFADAVQIVRMRGKLMQEAVPVGVGSMAAVISEGIDVPALKKMIEDLPVDVANINSANQVVISGDAAALPEAENRCRELFAAPKTFRFIKLNVSAPFHSRFMKKIEEPFAGTLKDFSKSFEGSNASKVTSNYAGTFHAPNVDAVINNLVRQLSNSVLWRENMQVLAGHASRIYEIGPGRPLRDFFRTIDVTCESITGLTAAEKVFARVS
ncbi:MAG: Malonyl CoA-acyl carrier protein transacylase [Deltaproteobacteria bacterium ADurb.Bin151]|jgi:[acyl-carrier-protein] S-malonyltransferase|nr:ACP S-malonyltransferase [Smithella sp.]OQB50638.1 MAG: Malonyl CoA-acyl carrier protein transacylase [Deltaproteobacteria bacterium ADurb.Bin151]HNZ10844.1 ACP S-malonyltransferase [Smithellaceae bacterium]HOG81163.1 ACP S-malonyltransferase [Smithellaceae bacterium]HOQ41916.1 ACP S-malonyltransferase [Smithellaceae bacterium]